MLLLCISLVSCRILLLACQRTDQAELAFELYQIMKSRGLTPRLNNAHSICYTLLSSCFSRIRKTWWPGGYPPKPTASMGPYSNLPGLRPAEARQLLDVLQPGAFPGAKGSGSGGGSSGTAAAGGSARQQQQQGRRFMFLDNADNINWPVLALSTYRCVAVLFCVCMCVALAGGSKNTSKQHSGVMTAASVPAWSRSVCLALWCAGTSSAGVTSHTLRCWTGCSPACGSSYQSHPSGQQLTYSSARCSCRCSCRPCHTRTLLGTFPPPQRRTASSSRGSGCRRQRC